MVDGGTGEILGDSSLQTWMILDGTGLIYGDSSAWARASLGPVARIAAKEERRRAPDGRGSGLNTGECQ